MAEFDNSSGASQLPMAETSSITTQASKHPRRKLTLISITILLNVLLWASLTCMGISIYQFVSNPNDTTSIPSEAFTVASAFVSIVYIILHTLFSFKQRTWMDRGRHSALSKNSIHIATRFAGIFCSLWLFTCGWNMITVARRPVCLSPDSGLEVWEYGSICYIDRVNISFAAVAFGASCALFGILAVIRRPFEAHLFKHGYRETSDLYLTPNSSRQPSRSGSPNPEKKNPARIAASTRRSLYSTYSNTDTETLDLDLNSPTPTIHAPSPVKSQGLEVFTSSEQPPPVPPAFLFPSHASPLGTRPTSVLSVSPTQHYLAPTGIAPSSVPIQFAPSVWRAVHPTLPLPTANAASRSHSHLPSTSSVNSFSYRSRHSQSSISLTRPQRLSSAMNGGSMEYSFQIGSAGPADGWASSGASPPGPSSDNSSTGSRTPGAQIPRRNSLDAQKKDLPLRKSRSASSLQSFHGTRGAGTISQTPQEVRILKSESMSPRNMQARRMSTNGLNKPASRLAVR